MPGTRRLRWSIAAALFLCVAGFTWWRIPAENVSTLTVPWSRDRRVIGLSSDARWGITVLTLWGRDSQASDEPSPWTGEWQQTLYGRNSNAVDFRTEIVVWDVPSARRFCSIPSGFAPLFSATDDRIYLTDSTGAIQVWNPVARKPWIKILPLWLGEALILFLVALFWRKREVRPSTTTGQAASAEAAI